jgi:hypothetical protein
VAYVIAPSICFRAEGVVVARDEPRFAFPSLVPPRLLRKVKHLANLLGVGNFPAYESVRPSANPPYRDGYVAADQQLGTPLAPEAILSARPRRLRLTGPYSLHKIALHISANEWWQRTQP